MKFVITVLYRYYDDNGKGTMPYERSLCSTLAVLLFNLTTVFNLLKQDLIQSLFFTKSRGGQYMVILILLMFGFFLLRAIYLKAEIKANAYPARHRNRDGLIVFAYVLVSFLLMIITTDHQLK